MDPTPQSGPSVGDLTDVGDQFMSVADAAAATARFRAANPGSVHSWLFSRGVLDVLLDQPGCAGIRVYRGVALDGTENIILAGTDEEGISIVPSAPGEAGLIGEEGWPCPPFCAPSTILDE